MAPVPRVLIASAVHERHLQRFDSLTQMDRLSKIVCLFLHISEFEILSTYLITSALLVRAQFRSEWEVIPTLPNVDKVYEAHHSRDILGSHDQYKLALFHSHERTLLTFSHRQDNPDKILIRTFHAAQCICDMGTKEPALCNLKSCGTCCIIKSSFKEFAFGERYNVGRYVINHTSRLFIVLKTCRYGKGIYVYRDPSLADQYATSCTSSPYRVMIACDTLVDQSQCMRSDEVRI